MISYKRAGKEELEEITALLTESFQGYPFFEMYIKDKKKQIRSQQMLLKIAVKTCYKKHIILIGMEDKKILSAALLKSPDKPKIGLMDNILAGGIKLLVTMGLRNTLGFLRMTEKSGSVCHSLPGRVWYLELLAISSSCQGQGLGSRILEDCIKPYIQKRGGGFLTLITNMEQNRKFYKKNGFEEFHEMIIRRNGKEIGNWSFRMKLKVEPRETMKSIPHS